MKIISLEIIILYTYNLHQLHGYFNRELWINQIHRNYPEKVQKERQNENVDYNKVANYNPEMIKQEREGENAIHLGMDSLP